MEPRSHNFITLSEIPVKFDPVSKVNNVFFDETNKQVFTVRSGGVTGVQVQGPTPELCHSFRMPDRGPVVSIKLSPAQRVLALQRTKTSVEFINLKPGHELEDAEYSQGSRNKTALVLGFVWSQSDEIIIVTDQGIELYQVIPEKRQVKALKSINSSVTWFISCPATQFLLLAGGSSSSNMQPISYAQPGTLVKAPKFHIEVPATSSKGVLLERDVTMTSLYGQTTILVLRHPPRPPGASQPPAQVLVYSMHRTLMTVRWTHTLLLESSGRCALSVVDNLVLVHHQASRSTLLFDTGGETDTQEPVRVKPLLPAQTIRSVMAHLPGQEPFQCQLYSPNWVVFQPNIIIDAKLGFLWYVDLDIEILILTSTPSAALVAMLLRRKNDLALVLLLKVIHDMTLPVTTSARDLSLIAQVFDTINAPYRRQLAVLAQPHTGSPVGGLNLGGKSTAVVKDTAPDMLVIDQSLMYSNVFSKFPEGKGMPDYDGDFAIKVIVEYIRSLTDAHIPVYDFNELLITCLLNEEHGLARLHLLLQYRVLSDSKPLACSLVSLEHVYPPALQLSLDMLKRLGTADDEIIEILLHKGQVLPCLRYATAVKLDNQISARKFLEAAQTTGDRSVFFSVFRFFEQRNQKLRGAPAFAKGELCDTFVEHFQQLFIKKPELTQSA